jgi:hypothetical protein
MAPVTVAFALLHHINKGTIVIFNPCIALGCNHEQQQYCAEPDIFDPELKSAFGDSRRPGADEHPILAVGLRQFLRCHRPTGNAQLTNMFYMPNLNQEGRIKANVAPSGAGFLETQCPLSSSALFCSANH